MCWIAICRMYHMSSYRPKSLQDFLFPIFTMAIASSSDFERRIALLQEMRRDLAAAGVPVEAWPRRLPRGYHAYTVRSAGGARIQVLLQAERFLVPYPFPPRGHSVTIPWRGNAAQAWEDAKRVAQWE